MAVDITIPSPGESITEVSLSGWLKDDGAYVEKDELLAEIESDKATLELRAPAAGALKIVTKKGDGIKVGTVVAAIDTSVGAVAAAAAHVSGAVAAAAAPSGGSHVGAVAAAAAPSGART